jgi:phosphoglycerate dehydrogenase-like enzyme
VPNLLLTPHIAVQTKQALLNVGTRAWNDTQAVLSGQIPRPSVGRAGAKS